MLHLGRSNNYIDDGTANHGRTYKDFVYHFPYFGLLACILCCIGGIMFSIETHSLEESVLMALQEVCHTAYSWMETSFVVCTSLGGLIVALSFLIFFASVALRLSNFKESESTSRTPSLVFLLLLYIALPIWTVLLGKHYSYVGVDAFILST